MISNRAAQPTALGVKTRLFAVTAMTCLLMSLALPAWAAGVTFVKPTASTVEGKAVTGSVALEVTAEPPSAMGLGLVGSTVTEIVVTIRPRAGFKSAGAFEQKDPGNHFVGTWDTNRVTPYNGGYDLEAVAKLSDNKTMQSTISNVLVNNPPTTPAKPNAAIEGTTAVVRWAANPEPDIISYKLSRSIEGEAFSGVATVEAGKPLNFTDTDAPAGKAVTYQVVALRRSPVSPAGLSSAASESGPVTIPTPAPVVVATDAAGNPVPVPAVVDPALGGASPLPPAAAAAPIPGATSAAPFPTRKGAPPPVFKGRPSEISFAETLPFGEAPPPQQFDTASEDTEELAAPSGIASAFTATNPVKFMILGTVLLTATFFLARTSRKLLKTAGPVDDFLTEADFSGLGDIQLPDADIVYPDFHALRT